MISITLPEGPHTFHNSPHPQLFMHSPSSTPAHFTLESVSPNMLVLWFDSIGPLAPAGSRIIINIDSVESVYTVKSSFTNALFLQPV